MSTVIDAGHDASLKHDFQHKLTLSDHHDRSTFSPLPLAYGRSPIQANSFIIDLSSTTHHLHQPSPTHTGHDNRIFHARFRPGSSSWFATASDNNTVAIWHKTPHHPRYMQVARYGDHADSVMRVAWATDSMTLASGSSDTTVRIWRLNNQLSLLHDEEDDKKEEEEEKNALGHGYNRSITSSKVKTSISTYNNHRRQRQCHHHQGRDLGFAGTHHLATLAGHEEEVYSCEWLGHYLSPTVDDDAGTNTDSLLLAASGEKLYLWDVSTQQLLSKIPPPNNTTTGGNGNDSSSSNNDASLPSSVSSLVPERWRAGYLFGVACQPGGPLIGAACSDGNLRFWGHSNGGRSIDSLFALPWNSAMGSDCSFMIPGTGTGSSSNSGVEEDASHMFAATAHNGAVVVVDLRTGGCLLHKILTPYDDNSGITSYHTQHQRRDVPCSLFSCELRKIDGRNTVVAASSLGKVALIDVSTGNTRFISPGNSNNSSNGQHSQAVKQQQQQQQTSSPSLLPFLTASVSEDGGRMIAAGECFRLEKGDIEGGGGGDGSIVEKWGPVHVWKVGA